MSRVLVTLCFCACSVPALADPYRYFGGKVEGEAKNEAMEACEYRELVEARRCNERINKSQCIEDVHEECRQRFSAQAGDAVPGEPGTPAERKPRQEQLREPRKEPL
jgi:hypothetical protein